MNSDALTTPAVLERMAGELPGHHAVITDERALTFAELHQEVRRAAAGMIALGVQQGDRVAILLPNSWQWVVGCLATHYAGGVVVPVNTGFTAGEASDVLRRSGARLLIAGERFDSAELPELRHVTDVPYLLAGTAASAAEVDARAAAVRPDDVADILFTSGTTGASKGVLCAHRQSLSASAAAAECREMTSADRYLCMAPFFHNYGYKDGILGCLQSGATLVTQRTFDPDQAMQLIAEQRITVLPGPPTLFQVLLDHPARKSYDLSSLRMAATGAAMVPVALVERILDELDVETVLTGYGLTEACGFGTACRRGDDAVTVATTCGRPIAGFEVRIDNPDGSGAGEILLRGPNVMLGYLDDPAATAAAIDDDGWLHTGDVGTLAAAGCQRITDRLTDAYICGGLNVYPAEVEAVLAGLEGVAEVAVIGVPDTLLGEVGRAFVVPRSGVAIREQTVIAHARQHLAQYKTPRSVVFVDQLPRNAAGKVLKTELRTIEYVPAPRFTPRRLGGPPVGPVEEWVSDVWQVLLNIERPGRRDAFTDLGGDSLAAVEFSRLLEKQFGVSMSVDRLADRPTIAAVVADLRAGTGARRQPVVNLRTDGAGPVCLTVPGIGGHAWKFVALARALTVHCDVLGLSPMDVRDGPAGDFRARIRSAALEALRPHVTAGRPIAVAGYSFGGLVATDLACWLPDQGVHVAKLVLLDPDPLDSAVPQWQPVSVHPTLEAAIFVPGSAAARQLDAEINVVARLLQGAYLDGSIRLPKTAVAWLQTSTMAAKHQPASMLFGTPAQLLGKTMVDVDHLDLLGVPGLDHVAPWLDRHLVF